MAAFIDRVDNLKMKEVNGVIRSLTRKARVVNASLGNDFTALLTTLNQAGIPQMGSMLIPMQFAFSSPFGQLVLEDRDVEVIDTNTIDVILEYKHFMEGDNQVLGVDGTESKPILSVFGCSGAGQPLVVLAADLNGAQLTTGALVQVGLGVLPPPLAAGINYYLAFVTINIGGDTEFSLMTNPNDIGTLVAITGAGAGNVWVVGSTTTGGSLLTPWNGKLFGKHKASVQQTKTNFYMAPTLDIPEWTPGADSAEIGTVFNYQGFYWITILDVPVGGTNPGINDSWRLAIEGSDYTVPDNAPKSKKQIQVGHKFPGTDKQVPNQTIFQTGEITVMLPHSNFTLSGRIITNQPWAIENAVLGCINSEPWQNGNPREWMCTEVSWEALFGTRMYKMSFEFQRNPDTWLPTAVFNDQRIGKPPPNLIANFGYVEVPYYTEIDFDDFFQSTFEQ